MAGTNREHALEPTCRHVLLDEIVPIPGTRRVLRHAENLGGIHVELTIAELQRLAAHGRG